ncbi:MAG: peptide deformylase [Clostridiales bacterium 38-18]|nr:MAG: peptide deformylase [Clostridiales bacterium 38-18]
MALRKIKQFDDVFLSKVSKPIEEVDDRIREILDDMVETMYHEPNGGGLAAVQVGILKRLVVADMGTGLYKLVNPVIVEKIGEQTVVEGCLSYPGVWGRVKRPLKVVVEALDEYGKPQRIEAVGALAKCFCHEIDHLDGIVFKEKVFEYID